MNVKPDTDMCNDCYVHSSKSRAQRPYECIFCSKPFTSKDSLRYHKYKYHGDTTNIEKIEQMLERCLRIARILSKAKRQAVQQEAAAQEEHDSNTFESCHVSSTTTFGQTI